MHSRAGGDLFVVFVLMLCGCSSGPNPADVARKAAEEQAVKEAAEREKAERERQKHLAETRLREELNKDLEQLLGHWDLVADKSRPSCHLEIAPGSVARFQFVVNAVESNNECKFQLNGEDGQRFLLPDSGSGKLKVTRLVYRFEGDRLTLQGEATDALLNRVDLSGEWRRTDWTRKSEAEIVHVLKRLNAHVEYDGNSPMKPIVKVSFAFQSPIRNVHLRPLTGLKRLQELDLSSAAEINDAGLKTLMPLTQLKQLNLTNTQVSREAVEEFQRNVPNCTILH